MKTRGGTPIFEVEHYTRVVGGVARYTISKQVEGDFPANGKPHDITAGDTRGIITIRCENGAVTMSINVPGYGEYRYRVTPLDSNTLEVVADVSERNGIYRKE